ncbi:MAG: (2Fe-2S)-binding protein [Thermodesulfobacteriota bacterium]|nr:(2Fe-2S)-binding protein [Thermodesulfobacteriota bacterium]
MKRKIVLNVNDGDYEVEVEPNRLLVDVIREDIGLTGTKKGCEIGVCGACTVLMDGKVVSSCLMLAVYAVGKKITTIEGLLKEGELHPLQKAFVDYGAFQCGFCTPGIILASKAMLDENPHPTEHEIREGLNGNLCRCTGYAKMVEAIQTIVAGK